MTIAFTIHICSIGATVLLKRKMDDKILYLGFLFILKLKLMLMSFYTLRSVLP